MVTSRATYVRGDVWIVDLDPTVGTEINKSRVCVIISPPELNESNLRRVIVAPMPSHTSLEAGFRPAIKFDSKNGVVAIDQLRAVSVNRLVQRKGALRPSYMVTVLDQLRLMFEE